MNPKPTETQQAIFEFAQFVENYPLNFIDQCWGKDCPIYEYLNKILKYRSSGNFLGAGAFIRFFNKLDLKNKLKLLDWIKKFNKIQNDST